MPNPDSKGDDRKPDFARSLCDFVQKNTPRREWLVEQELREHLTKLLTSLSEAEIAEGVKTLVVALPYTDETIEQTLRLLVTLQTPSVVADARPLLSCAFLEQSLKEHRELQRHFLGSVVDDHACRVLIFTLPSLDLDDVDLVTILNHSHAGLSEYTFYLREALVLWAGQNPERARKFVERWISLEDWTLRIRPTMIAALTQGVSIADEGRFASTIVCQLKTQSRMFLRVLAMEVSCIASAQADFSVFLEILRHDPYQLASEAANILKRHPCPASLKVMVLDSLYEIVQKERHSLFLRPQLDFLSTVSELLFQIDVRLAIARLEYIQELPPKRMHSLDVLLYRALDVDSNATIAFVRAYIVGHSDQTWDMFNIFSSFCYKLRGNKTVELIVSLIVDLNPNVRLFGLRQWRHLAAEPHAGLIFDEPILNRVSDVEAEVILLELLAGEMCEATLLQIFAILGVKSVLLENYGQALMTRLVMDMPFTCSEHLQSLAAESSIKTMLSEAVAEFRQFRQLQDGVVEIRSMRPTAQRYNLKGMRAFHASLMDARKRPGSFMSIFPTIIRSHGPSVVHETRFEYPRWRVMNFFTYHASAVSLRAHAQKILTESKSDKDYASS